MKPNATQPRPPKPQWQTFIAVVMSGILVLGLTAAIAWFGPDPGDVVKASSPKVPDFSHLSKEEAIAELQAIVLDKPLDDLTSSIELSGDGNLQFKWKSTQSDFQSSRAIPLAQLDQFLYAEQTLKGDRNWSIHVYCANYQKCITGSNSRTAGSFTLNADGILYMPRPEMFTKL